MPFCPGGAPGATAPARRLSIDTRPARQAAGYVKSLSPASRSKEAPLRGGCKYGDDRRASAVWLIAPSPSSAAENIFTFCAFSMRCRQENFRMPFFRAPRASMAMPRAHANNAASERPSALSVGCSQPVFGRREHFHVLRLFNGLQAGKFPLPSFEGARARRWRRRGRMQILRRAKSLRALVWLLPARPRPSRKFPRFAPFQCVAGRKISRPLSEPRPAMPRAAVGGGDLARSRFREFGAVAVNGAAGRRSPVLVGNARRAFTHRPPLRQGDAVRRLSAEADADRVASKRKRMNDPQTEPGRRSTITQIVFYGMINVINSEKYN